MKKPMFALATFLLAATAFADFGRFPHHHPQPPRQPSFTCNVIQGLETITVNVTPRSYRSALVEISKFQRFPRPRNEFLASFEAYVDERGPFLSYSAAGLRAEINRAAPGRRATGNIDARLIRGGRLDVRYMSCIER